MDENDANAIQKLAVLLTDVLINNSEGDNALHCAAALGVTLAALAKNAKEQNDLVFGFGIDTAMKIYEKNRN